MNAVFDTLKAVKALREAGFDEAQAEALVETVGEAVTETVATQASLSATEAKLSGDLASVEARLTGDLASVEARLTGDLASVEARVTGDLASVEARLDGDMKAGFASVRTEIATLKAEMFKQFWIMGVGIVAVTVTLIKVL